MERRAYFVTCVLAVTENLRKDLTKAKGKEKVKAVAALNVLSTSLKAVIRGAKGGQVAAASPSVQSMGPQITKLLTSLRSIRTGDTLHAE